MDAPSREELREWTRALTLSALDPTDESETRYVALQHAGREAADELRATIELAFDPTTQLLSGPSGSGKTTELNRLVGELQGAGFHAAVIDVTRYANQSSPIDITTFLVAVALGAQDVLGARSTPVRPGFGARLRALARRLRVTLDVGGVRAAADDDSFSVSAAGVEVELARELRSSETTVEQLRRRLGPHVGELHREVSDFLASLLPADDPRSGSVLVVDGLEKLRGTRENDEAVQASIQALFVAQAANLKFASHHVVYTVPTYLQFTAPGALPYSARVIPVPVPNVYPRPGRPADSVRETVAELRDVVARRLPTDRLFTGPEQLDRLLRASGGHLRDLFSLLQQLVKVVQIRSVVLPVSDDDVERAISTVAHDFAQITAEQAGFLLRVHECHGTVRPADDEVQLMARLLQSHMLLCHLNAEDWYEVHPLARRALALDDPA